MKIDWACYVTAKCRWTLWGALFGVCFPVLALIIRFSQLGIDGAINVIIQDPLLWIIFTAPVFLGIFAFLGGREHEKSVCLNETLEEQVEIKSQQLLQTSKMATLGEAAGSIAHELINPVSVLKMLIQNLKTMSKNHTDEKCNGIILKLEKNLNRIEKIIKGIRTFASAQFDEKIEPILLKEIYEEVTEFTEIKRKHAGIEFSIESFDENIKIDCYPILLAQVLLNLVNNGCDAIEKRTERWIKIKTQITENEFVIQVTDSGNGVPLEIQEKLKHGAYTSKPKEKGTGLGLVISKEIIQRHKGQLTIDNSQTHTTFLITIPRNLLQKIAA